MHAIHVFVRQYEFRSFFALLIQWSMRCTGFISWLWALVHSQWTYSFVYTIIHRMDNHKFIIFQIHMYLDLTINKTLIDNLPNFSLMFKHNACTNLNMLGVKMIINYIYIKYTYHRFIPQMNIFECESCSSKYSPRMIFQSHIFNYKRNWLYNTQIILKFFLDLEPNRIAFYSITQELFQI